MTSWSPQQSEALAKAGAWLRMRYQPVFYLAGFAGTGKTTLAIHLAKHATGKVAFAAFTGKAARVMRTKGCSGASTIHSLIYNSTIDDITGKVHTSVKPRSALEKFCLVIIDECSMVNEEIGKDLESFGVPILVLGDPAQLPPVNGGGYFTNRKPDYMLTEVHRQAGESPILWLATQIREGRWDRAPVSLPGLDIVTKGDLDPQAVTSADIVIVGRNETRQKYNRRLRELRKKTDDMPQIGEPVICLRNDKETKVFNGDILTVAKRRTISNSISLWLDDPDGQRPTAKVRVRKDFFYDDVKASQLGFKTLKGTQQFTFGYVITCHKSQGSQWDEVCVFNEAGVFRDDADRWLYTAVTRAAERLTVVI